MLVSGSLVFSKLSKLAILAFLFNFNGNILEIVASQMDLNTNLDFSRACGIKPISLVSISN